MTTDKSSPVSGVPGAVIGADDEINLTDLFRNLWRQRGMIVGTALLTVLAVMSFHFAKASFSLPRLVEYPVSLTFLDASGQYPNGTVFSPDDVIASGVVKTTAETLEVKQSMDDINKALSVRFSNSLLESSERQLADLLSNAKTPQDIRLAAETALNGLRQKSRGFLTISMNLDESGMTAKQAELFLTRLLDTWAKMAIERGLANVDIDRPLQPFAVSQNVNLIDLYDNAANYLASLNRTAMGLSEQPGAASLVVGGRTLDDIRRELKTLDDTDIGPLREFAYSNSARLAEQDAAIRVRLFSRQRLLNLEYDRLTKLISSYDLALSQLSQSSVRDAAGGSQNSQMAGAQFDQSFLDSLLELGNKLGGMEMRQQLFERRTKAIEDRLQLEKELAILRGSDDKSNGKLDAQSILRGAMEDIMTSLNTLQQQLDAFVVAYRVQTLQSGGRLYVADAAPVVRGGTVQMGTRIGLHTALALVLGTMLGMMLALIRAAMINSRQNA